MSNLSDIKLAVERLSKEDRDALSSCLEDTSPEWPSRYRVEEARPDYPYSAAPRESIQGAGAMLELRSLGITVPLEEVYEGVLA